MSSYDDNPPSAYWETSPRAKKQRRCYECRSIIPIGVLYRGIAGIWDRQFDHFTLCMRCARLHEWLRTVDEPTCFGQLMEAISEAGLRPWLKRIRLAGPQWDDSATLTTEVESQPVEETSTP